MFKWIALLLGALLAVAIFVLLIVTWIASRRASIIVGGRYKMLQQRGMGFTDLLANTDAVIKLARQPQK